MPKTEKTNASNSKGRSTKPVRSPKPASKTDQLKAALARKCGASSSALEKKLGWQKHTVRAAISRLRKAGVDIVTEKNTKTGEAVYRLKPAGSPSSDKGDIRKQNCAVRSSSNDQSDHAVTAA